MTTLAPLGSTCRHATLRLKTTRPTEFIDLTDRIRTLVEDGPVQTGLVNVQTLHTTTAIVVNEHEPLLFADFVAMLHRAAPGNLTYRHDSPARTVNLTPGERINGHAHCRALLLPSSALVNVVDSTLVLGRWQRIFFVELDGPQQREVSVVVLESAR
jgi:secondary thiamine-phosphate synthase enzyme